MSDQTTPDLAAALDAFDTCLPDVRRVLIDVDILRLAAQRLRELEAVRVAARGAVDARDGRLSNTPAKWCACDPCRKWDGRECDRLTALRAALARIKGGE